MELLRFEMLLPAFALVLARVAGLVLAVPFFSSSQIPGMIKIILVVSISLMIFPAAMPHLPHSLTLPQAFTGMVGEFAFGEILGLAAGLTLFAAQLAGQIVSYQSGMSFGQILNPLSDEEAGIIDQIWYFAAMAFFLALRGHVAVVEVLLHSFAKLPPLRVFADASVLQVFNILMHSCLEMALRLAGPAVLALLLTSLVLGVLTKTMPQLNIMTVGFSFKIFVGLFMVALTITVSDGVLTDGAADALDQVGGLLDKLSRSIAHGI